MNDQCRAYVKITLLRWLVFFVVLTPVLWLLMPGAATTMLALSFAGSGVASLLWNWVA